jgi:rhamnose transport system permease protein
MKTLPNALARFRRPEVGTLLVLVASIIFSHLLSPFFRDLFFVLDSSSFYVEFGIVALPLTFVIIAGLIDLSVASQMALVACVSATFYELGLPFGFVIAGGLLLGMLLGTFNGFLVTFFRLPSIIVTIATLSLYRGLAQVLLGDHSIGRFPDWFVGFDMRYAGIVPAPLIVFTILTIITGIILNRTLFGRATYAIGTNERAAVFSGINVVRHKMILFITTGFFAALGGLMMISRLGVARYDLAEGGELEVVTIALLGGTDINGGRGNVIGTFIAFFVLVVLKSGMSVANFKIENQLAIIGSLLIVAIVVTNLMYSKRGA